MGTKFKWYRAMFSLKLSMAVEKVKYGIDKSIKFLTMAERRAKRARKKLEKLRGKR